jgi:hypothetical protein
MSSTDSFFVAKSQKFTNKKNADMFTKNVPFCYQQSFPISVFFFENFVKFFIMWLGHNVNQEFSRIHLM